MLGTTLLWLGAIAVGFVLLNQGAKFITDNATRISGKIGRSRFVVGALLVSTLSALPELLVSGFAVEVGSTDLALGTALASTVVTIAFVIGASALLRPIKTSKEIVLRDAVWLAIVTVVAATMLLDGNLTQYEGVALIALFVPYILNLVISQRTGPREEIEARMEDMEIGLEFTGWIFGRKVVVRAGLKWLVFGILWSVMGAQFLVQGAIGLSAAMGMNPWFIGITVAARHRGGLACDAPRLHGPGARGRDRRERGDDPPDARHDRHPTTHVPFGRTPAAGRRSDGLHIVPPLGPHARRLADHLPFRGRPHVELLRHGSLQHPLAPRRLPVISRPRRSGRT